MTGKGPLPPATDNFDAILDGLWPDGRVREFLATLADRGEKAADIAAAAMAMRDRMIRVTAPGNAIDVCGTGGDGQHSLNISTAVAIIIAAMDIPVAKHGNRAASSKAGAADTLEALGLDLDRAAANAEASLREIGIAFFFAQKYHPALAPLAPLRKEMGRRTIFNLLGPLCNPAGVKRQLIGIARPDLLTEYAEAVRALSYEKVMLVSGEEGLDEISIAGPTRIALIDGDAILHSTIRPEDVGLPRHDPQSLRGGDAQFNARALTRLLDGEKGAYRDAVLFNCAAALIVADAVHSWEEGIEEAAEAIDKGLAKGLLNCWIANQ